MIKTIARALGSSSRSQETFLKLATYSRFADWKDQNPTPLIGGGPRQKRNSLFEKIFSEIGNTQIYYFEFGVHEGKSIQWWAEKNTREDLRFFGFDSFEGLPEDWRNGKGEGYFSTDGKTPVTSDVRVEFVKGWFHHTLDTKMHDIKTKVRKVIHFDADLYRSTIFPLMNIGAHLRSGDVIIFDEFLDSIHEFRAFEEYQAIFNAGLRLIGATEEYAQVAFEIT